MKRSGFTMIELIFVIVILGILAAVAIPKLAATRTDAGVSKLATNVSTLVSDFGAYWTSQGGWATNYNGMTNVGLFTEPGGITNAGTITALDPDDIAALAAARSAFDTAVSAYDGYVSGGGDPAVAPGPTLAQAVTDTNTTYQAAIPGGTLVPVYINAAGNGLADGCYSLTLSSVGDVTITALSTGTSPVCLGAKDATLKTNMTAADGVAKVHEFGGAGVQY